MYDNVTKEIEFLDHLLLLKAVVSAQAGIDSGFSLLPNHDPPNSLLSPAISRLYSKFGETKPVCGKMLHNSMNRIVYSLREVSLQHWFGRRRG
jgi:hypothetical protein